MDWAIEAFLKHSELETIFANRSLDLILIDLLKDSPGLPLNDTRIASSLHIMRKDYAQKLTLDSIGKRVGLSPLHFRELFQDLIGVSPSVFLRRLRLQKAKELLIATDKPIQEIANLTGWENASTFIRVFSKCTDVTPGVFRKLNHPQAVSSSSKSSPSSL